MDIKKAKVIVSYPAKPKKKNQVSKLGDCACGDSDCACDASQDCACDDCACGDTDCACG